MARMGEDDPKEAQEAEERPGSSLDDLSIDRPRLTPQGRTNPDPSGTDSTSPTGSGAKTGQPDKAEG